MSEDPLTLALNGLIPADETPAERAQRLALEEQARKVSEAIDERLRQERIERRNKKIVKILLLGTFTSPRWFIQSSRAIPDMHPSHPLPS